MRKAGVFVNCGGSGSRAVSALNGWVRSTTRNLPLFNWSMSSIKTLAMSCTSGFLSAGNFFYVATELEAVFQQGQLCHVTFGTNGLHLGHDAGKLVGLHGFIETCFKLGQCAHRG